MLRKVHKLLMIYSNDDLVARLSRSGRLRPGYALRPQAAWADQGAEVHPIASAFAVSGPEGTTHRLTNDRTDDR